jgi:hypothetical protein
MQKSISKCNDLFRTAKPISECKNPFENGGGSIPNEGRAFWTGMGWGNPFENAFLHFRMRFLHLRMGRYISEWGSPSKPEAA